MNYFSLSTFISFANTTRGERVLIASCRGYQSKPKTLISFELFESYNVSQLKLLIGSVYMSSRLFTLLPWRSESLHSLHAFQRRLMKIPMREQRSHWNNCVYNSHAVSSAQSSSNSFIILQFIIFSSVLNFPAHKNSQENNDLQILMIG